MNKTIRIKGSAKLDLPPDAIILKFTQKEILPTYSQALKEASKKKKALSNLLNEFDIKNAELKTLDFYVNSEYKRVYSKKNDNDYENKLVGYKYTQKLKLTLPLDNKLLSNILFTISSSKLEPEIDISYSILDVEDAKNQLLTIAVKDATKKAEILTKAANVKLGDIVSIDYSWSEINIEPSFDYSYDNKMMATENLNNYNLDINPDDISINDTVTVIWEIK